MITQLFTQDCVKIMFLFSLSPGSRFDRNMVKEKVMLNNISLDRAIRHLLSSNIIKREKRFYSINFENEYSKRLLEICSKQHKELKEIPLNIFFLLMDFIKVVSLIKGMDVFLFGSYSKLIYSEKSDVDIAIISDKTVPLKTTKLEKKYGKIIEVHYFKKDFWKNKKDPLIKSILKDGIKLI